MFFSAHSVTFFFFNDTATTEIYTLSLHDALPIYSAAMSRSLRMREWRERCRPGHGSAAIIRHETDRKSTRLNSSHVKISYAVFCLKKKRKYSGRSVRKIRNTSSTSKNIGGRQRIQ